MKRKRREPDTALGLLTTIHMRFRLTPDLDRRIGRLVNNPLTSIPDCIENCASDIVGDLCQEHVSFEVGTVNDGEFSVRISHDDHRTVLRIGCHGFYSEWNARTHWPKGISIMSGEYRDYAIPIIDWMARVCRHKGWRW